LHCHGNMTYSYAIEWSGNTIRKILNPYYRIDTTEFYQSNHKNFRCVDCHSDEYEDFPHPGELKMEASYTCLDCHEGDEDHADYQFERLAEEFEASVHFDRHSTAFTCWKCHDPHAYKTMARNSNSIVEIVAHNNAMCMDCHQHEEKQRVFSDTLKASLEVIHHWLPNQSLHFNKVRCLECHTPIPEDILISHKVLAKEQAVKNCVECHSTNSRLMASLYTFNNLENRSRTGFLNAVILNEAYVIGANRNYILNALSIIIFGMVMLGIMIHASLRIRKRNS